MKKNTKKGFTLVELLVVIAILAILATVSVVGYTSFINKADLSNAQTEAAQIKLAINTALINNDYVKVSVHTTTGTTPTTTTIYASINSSTNAVEFTTTQPTGTKVGDITSETSAFAANLSVDSTNKTLTYKYSDKVSVDVMSGTKK